MVIFTIRSEQLRVLLVRRGKKPYRGMLALPGGFVRPGESLENTTKRELWEETGLNSSGIRLEQLHTCSRPERSPGSDHLDRPSGRHAGSAGGDRRERRPRCRLGRGRAVAVGPARRRAPAAD
ncbi:NUDIX domain-containing protein [Streptomyces anulatus]